MIWLLDVVAFVCLGVGFLLLLANSVVGIFLLLIGGLIWVGLRVRSLIHEIRDRIGQARDL